MQPTRTQTIDRVQAQASPGLNNQLSFLLRETPAAALPNPTPCREEENLSHRINALICGLEISSFLSHEIKGILRERKALFTSELCQDKKKTAIKLTLLAHETLFSAGTDLAVFQAHQKFDNILKKLVPDVSLDQFKLQVIRHREQILALQQKLAVIEVCGGEVQESLLKAGNEFSQDILKNCESARSSLKLFLEEMKKRDDDANQRFEALAQAAEARRVRLLELANEQQSLSIQMAAQEAQYHQNINKTEEQLKRGKKK